MQNEPITSSDSAEQSRCLRQRRCESALPVLRHFCSLVRPANTRVIPANAGIRWSPWRAIFRWRLDPRARADDGRVGRGVGLRQGCPLGFAHKQAACCTWRSQGQAASSGIGRRHTPANTQVSATISPFAAHELTFFVTVLCGGTSGEWQPVCWLHRCRGGVGVLMD